MKLTFEQWVAAVVAACHKTRAVLEMPQGMFDMHHAYYEAHLTVEEAVEYYSGKDTGVGDSLVAEMHGSIAAKLDDDDRAWLARDEDIFNNSVVKYVR